MSEWYEKVIYEEDSRLLSWLMFRTAAELFGEDEEENLDLMTNEEEQWVRAVAKYGPDEAPFNFITVFGNVATSVIDITAEDEPKGSDWVSSETVKQDGSIRQEFKEDWNSMADRPTENFFLGLAGVIFSDEWIANHTTCPNCFVLTPTQTDECTVCDFNLVSN